MNVRLTLLDHWRLFRRRLDINTLKVGTKFEFHPRCILLTAAYYHRFQEVIHVTSYDIDGFGHMQYNVTSRGKDNRVVSFTTSTLTVHTSRGAYINPRHLLNRKRSRA